MTPERRASNTDWPEWMNEAWQKAPQQEGSLGATTHPSDGKDELEIRTKEGVMRVAWGDWIIRGVQNELYPCKPDIFAATYEPA